MQVQELTMRDFLSHLHRHPIPEIMDDVCLASLSSVEEQYGDTITHGAGLEVRLGEEARYVDYIMNIDEDAVPGVQSLWYEIDYEEFYKRNIEGGDITPCLFANTGFDPDDVKAWDEFLPAFLGEMRAEKLRPAFDRVLDRLPEGTFVKQIGTMTSRGELNVMRLVIMFSSWDDIPEGLAAIGWQGDTNALREALSPWKETQNIAVNIDLGEGGVLPKIGVEVFSRWRHPVLVDKFLACLEDAGLCLPSKGDALRRWIRILPDGSPFIQTLISYFKLSYRDGKITEAKAYLEQSPYIHHHYFEAYDRPVRLDIELTRGETSLPIDHVTDLVRECRRNRIRQVRLYGAQRYADLGRLLPLLKEHELHAEIVLEECVNRDVLMRMKETEDAGFLVEIKKPSQDDPGLKNLALLQEEGITPVRARYHMYETNAGALEFLTGQAKALGVAELIVTGMCAGDPDPSQLGRDDIKDAAAFISNYESNGSMEITVDSCFSPLRAYMGGKDKKKNPNRGIRRGCEAGCSFMAVRSDGKFSPCLMLADVGEEASLEVYWKQSDSLRSIRDKKNNAACGNCPYERRCRPCPVLKEFRCHPAPLSK